MTAPAATGHSTLTSCSSAPRSCCCSPAPGRSPRIGSCSFEGKRRAAGFRRVGEPLAADAGGPLLRVVTLLFLIGPALAGGGCGGTITPPRAVRDPVPVYVADYGRHATLLLPVEDGGLEEFAFGDWRWLAMK